MGGISRAIFSFRAAKAHFAKRSAVASELPEPVFPHVGKTIAGNIALNKFRKAFYIETGIDISVAKYAADIDPRAAYKIIVPQFMLVFI